MFIGQLSFDAEYYSDYLQFLRPHTATNTIIKVHLTQSSRKGVIPRLQKTDLSSELSYKEKKLKLWQCKHCAQHGMPYPSQGMFVTGICQQPVPRE